MLKRIVLCLLALTTAIAPASAETSVFSETTVTVEDEWLDDGVPAFTLDIPGKRIAQSAGAQSVGLARFGVFSVRDGKTAELSGTVTTRTPQDFAAMLRAYPAISTLQITECDGTDDDEANLKLARMVRARGMTTYVPAFGSARSGGVELFLAGARRRADHGAEFAVHSWRDDEGYEASDFPISDAVHADYIRFYREMGMSDANAHAFYQLTNSVSFDDVLWLTKADLARFIPVE